MRLRVLLEVGKVLHREAGEVLMSVMFLSDNLGNTSIDTKQEREKWPANLEIAKLLESGDSRGHRVLAGANISQAQGRHLLILSKFR